MGEIRIGSYLNLNAFTCKKKLNSLLNLESCGLDVIYGMFQTGV